MHLDFNIEREDVALVAAKNKLDGMLSGLNGEDRRVLLQFLLAVTKGQ